MKIISFSNVPVQPFWSAPVQALAPWISRLRNSLAHAVELPGALHQSMAQPMPVKDCAQTASNDSMCYPEAVIRSQPVGRIVPVPALTNISLRFVRESDTAIRPDCAGRMVISGRMADVCAELDLMALRAAATDANAATEL